MESYEHKTAILPSALSLFMFLIFYVVNVGAQTLPPARTDGFVYKNHRVNSDTIIIEAFYDPVCPDSRDSRYHDNAFVASRALHIVNNLNTSATFPLLEHFFKYQFHIQSTLHHSFYSKTKLVAYHKQEKFYNAQTRNLSRAVIVEEIVKFATEVVGSSYYSVIKSGFNDTKTDLKTRISFKYSTSRGVYGTPFFFVNGFLLPDNGSTIDFKGWKSTIDTLIGAQGNKGHLFL
ncbi:hypothetical protein CFP56_004135 [Quercus suber]|uniref:Thioredoxin-like fold domain-containing protein n=1 Tax=Quercus suber TaxID=58331 RepID=A0AAW0II21_QUESU